MIRTGTACDRAVEFTNWKNWYSVARRDIRHVCRGQEWDVEYFTAILSITSARLSLTRNIRQSMHYMSTGSWLNGLLTMTRRSVIHFNRTGRIRGPKVSAFNDALLGHRQAVVIDVWTSRTLGLPDKFNLTQFRAGVVRIQQTADHLGWWPVEVQSALWCWGMSQYNRTLQYYPIRSIESEFRKRRTG